MLHLVSGIEKWWIGALYQVHEKSCLEPKSSLTCTEAHASSSEFWCPCVFNSWGSYLLGCIVTGESSLVEDSGWGPSRDNESWWQGWGSSTWGNVDGNMGGRGPLDVWSENDMDLFLKEACPFHSWHFDIQVQVLVLAVLVSLFMYKYYCNSATTKYS